MAALPPNVHISKHPCLQAKLSQLRSASTDSRDTKRLVHDIATIVGCEALAQALHVVEEGTDTSPLGYAYPTVTTAPATVSLIPILRSGLSMLPAIEALLPAPVPTHHLGMYREKSTLQPVEYYNNLPYHKKAAAGVGDEGGPAASELAIVVDPVIATGSTVSAAIDTLRDWGVKRVLVIAVLSSADGLRRAAETWEDGVEIWVGGCDRETDERGMIKPGIGDIGDRLFMTLGK